MNLCPQVAALTDGSWTELVAAIATFLAVLTAIGVPLWQRREIRHREADLDKRATDAELRAQADMVYAVVRGNTMMPGPPLRGLPEPVQWLVGNASDLPVTRVLVDWKSKPTPVVPEPAGSVGFVGSLAPKEVKDIPFPMDLQTINPSAAEIERMAMNAFLTITFTDDAGNRWIKYETPGQVPAARLLSEEEVRLERAKGR